MAIAFPTYCDPWHAGNKGCDIGGVDAEHIFSLNPQANYHPTSAFLHEIKIGNMDYSRWVMVNYSRVGVYHTRNLKTGNIETSII